LQPNPYHHQKCKTLPLEAGLSPTSAPYFHLLANSGHFEEKTGNFPNDFKRGIF